MPGLIYDIKRFALHDGPGIRTTVFFKGCPLNCWWCHNPESRNPCIEKSVRVDRIDDTGIEVEEETGYEISSPDLLAEILKDKVFMEESDGGVTISGGEPFMQSSFLKEILTLCRGEGVHTAVDTSGYVQEDKFRVIAGLADLFLFDIKHIDDSEHLRYTSVSNELIFKNLEFLHNNRIPTIIRFPVVRGVNDGDHLKRMAGFLQKKYPDFSELHILPFHNIAAHKYEKFGLENRMKDTKIFSERELEMMSEVFKNKGFKVKTGG